MSHEDNDTHEDLHSRAEALASTYLAQGVTFDHAGEERPFPLDLVPRVVSSDDWDIIDPGVAQRVRTVEAFLAMRTTAGMQRVDVHLPARG